MKSNYIFMDLVRMAKKRELVLVSIWLATFLSASLLRVPIALPANTPLPVPFITQLEWRYDGSFAQL
jgi:hypothetical protein